MKAIFQQNCESWNDRNCPSEDLRDLYKKKMIEGNKFKWPEEEKLINLNDICSSCNEPLKIQEKKCPVCDNEDLQPPKLIKGGKAASIDIYNYRCEPCDRVLYSHGTLD